MTRVGTPPLVVVHQHDEKLSPGFREILRAGGQVRLAPSYRVNHTFNYPPRNTPGSLLEAVRAADHDTEFFVLCDPDMIFIREPAFGTKLSGDFYSYIDFSQEVVQEAARNLGMQGRQELQCETIRCGVPHVIPKSCADEFAKAWLRAIDAFTTDLWERSMYSFGFAAVQLGLEVELTHFVDHNGWPQEPVRADMIHYCYGNDDWTKRAFISADQAAHVWNPSVEPTKKTILCEIIDQINEARSFYTRFQF